MIDPLELQNESTARYLTDPEFHARARVACSLVHWTARQEGVTLTMGQEDVIVQSVCYGLLIAEHDCSDLANGPENHEHMLAMAAAMGVRIAKTHAYDAEKAQDDHRWTAEQEA